MYDLQSYLGKMSAGLTTHKRLEESRYGKAKKKKRINQVSSHANFHCINYNLTEDDLP